MERLGLLVGMRNALDTVLDSLASLVEAESKF